MSTQGNAIDLPASRCFNLPVLVLIYVKAAAQSLFALARNFGPDRESTRARLAGDDLAPKAIPTPVTRGRLGSTRTSPQSASSRLSRDQVAMKEKGHLFTVTVAWIAFLTALTFVVIWALR